MNKNQEFDMLENADDKTVELLSEVPVLSAAEKERILKMSIEKLKRKNEKAVPADNSCSKNTSESMNDNQMRIVEERRKIRWQYAVPAAACIILVCGILGTSLHKKELGKPSEDKLTDLPATSVTELTTAVTIAESEKTTRPVTDIVSEITDETGSVETVKEIVTVPAESSAIDRPVSDNAKVTDVPTDNSESENRSGTTAEGKEHDEKVTEQTENADKEETLITQSDEDTDNTDEICEFNWPVAGGFGVISKRYGISSYESGFHKGIDIIGPEGDDISGKEVTAAADGIVFHVTDTCTHNQEKNDCDCGGGYGNYVVIRHKDCKYCTLYAHLGSVTVSVGQEVSAGEIIGYVGATGRADQPKLHLEVRNWPFEWTASNTIDPEEFITAPNE